MFCPVGFRPAAALWIEFLEHRLQSAYDSAALHYGKPNFIAGLVRGSPLDICEHLFLKTLATVGFHLASPRGDVVKVHVFLMDGTQHLLAVLNPYASGWHAAAISIEAENTNGGPALLPTGFSIWDHDVSENDAWAETYQEGRSFEQVSNLPPFLELRHHSLPFHFTRRAYVISKDVPEFALESSRSWDVAPILENFAGWAICLDEETYQGEWAEYLHNRKQLFWNDAENSMAAAQGRPRLEEARAAFEAMGFDKGALSWEQVAKKIELMTGKKPSAKSLRNWQAEHLSKTK